MKRVTVKVGSTFFIDDNGNVNILKIKKLISEISALKNRGIDVCLVTSGAIAVGTKKMKLARKPSDTVKKQALAAIGQMSLMQIYEDIFEEFGLKCAQILLCHDDFGSRTRLNTLKSTLCALFDYGVVPVVNENDAVATAEIKVGDNDTLSAMTSLVIESDLLVLVSDVNGLYTANPITDQNAQFIPLVNTINESIINLAKAPSSEYGTGGMLTKIRAAQICSTAGIPMQIINQTKIDKLSQVADGVNLGTYFSKSPNPESLRKCWLQFCASIQGSIEVDDGAKQALKLRSSLLSCGIIKISGEFTSNSVVEILGSDKKPFARGICSFSNEAVEQFIKEKSTQMIIHANNIIISEN